MFLLVGRETARSIAGSFRKRGRQPGVKKAPSGSEEHREDVPLGREGDSKEYGRFLQVVKETARSKGSSFSKERETARSWVGSFSLLFYLFVF